MDREHEEVSCLTIPQPANRNREVMIVSGEASGDMHGARLVRAMLEQDPDISFCGMGGTELRAAGVEILYDAHKLAVVGITEVISHLGDILAARRILTKRMRESRPALLILIDYPDFNLLLAARAKKLGVPVFYYISPQVWAWRKGRTRKIGNLTDRIAVILPFEQQFYAGYGIDVDFVGHPLMDGVHTSMTKDAFLHLHNIPEDNTIIGLLPGSRSREIRNLLPDFLRAAALLTHQVDAECTFLVPRASSIPESLLMENGLSNYKKTLDVRVISENRYDLMAACKAVVAASGTVALELAMLDVPAVVTYRVSPRTYRIGRLLVRGVKYFSLVNLIADQQVIPELLQDEVTPERIAAELKAMLDDGPIRQNILAGLENVRRLIGGPGASDRAAEIALDTMLTWKKHRQK